MSYRTQFFFEEIDENGKIIGQSQLKLTICILGLFSHKNIDFDSYVINSENLDDIFRELNVTYTGEIENHLCSEPAFFKLDCSFDSIHKLQTDALLDHCELIVSFVQLLDYLEQQLVVGEIDISEFSERYKSFITKAGGDIGLVGENALFTLCTRLRENLNAQINAFLYEKKWLELQFNWLSLKHLLAYAKKPHHTIKIINLSKEEFILDMEDSEPQFSSLFQTIYSQEIDQYGGEPIAMCLVNHYLDVHEHFKVIHNVAQMGKLAFCPFIFPVNESFFGMKKRHHLEEDFDFQNWFERENFLPMLELSKLPQARYVVFLLSDSCVQTRLATERVYNWMPTFLETPLEQEVTGLWGSSIFYFMQPFFKCYQATNNCMFVDETQFNLIHPVFDASLNQNEAALFWEPTLRLSKDLAARGVVNLKVRNKFERQKVFVISNMHSFNAAGLVLANLLEVPANERIKTRLPQLLFICMLGHYLRLIERQQSSVSDTTELRETMIRWIRQFISDIKKDDETLTRKPLKSAKIDLVNKTEGGFNQLEIKLAIEPHAPFRGLEYTLEL